MPPQKKGKTKTNPRIRAEKEKRKSQIIIIGFIITAVIIVGMIGYAFLYSAFLKDRIPAATVNGNDLDNEYFKARVRFERFLYIDYFNSVKEMAEQSAEDPESADYYTEQLAQIQGTLSDYGFIGEVVLDQMIEDEIIEQQAKELGVDVSDGEIDEVLQQRFNYYPEGTPTAVPFPTPYPTPTLSKTQVAILGPTLTPSDELEEPVVEESIEGDEADETALPTDEAAPDGSESTPAATFTPYPTATPVTEELFQADLAGYIKELESIEVSEKHLRRYIYQFLLQQKVQEAVIADVPNEEEQVWARHILVETTDDAVKVLSRLEDESWNAVAADVSIDTSNKDKGGDLGWFGRDRMVPEFEEAAFDMDIGEISDPIETDFGWHIIQLVDKGDHPLDPYTYESKQSAAYDDWFNEVQDSSEIEINEVWKDLVPEEPKIE